MSTCDFTVPRNGKKRAPERRRATSITADLAAADVTPSLPIRILIADHHPDVRDGLRALLSKQPDFVVVGVSGDGAGVLRLAKELAPDLLLVDLSMPMPPGLDLLRQLKAVASGTRTVVLATAMNRAEAVKALRLGARGLVLKSAPAELFCKCIRKVRDGELWFNRDTIGAFVQSLGAAAAEPIGSPVHIRLTPREHEITRHIVSGDTNQVIARRLSVGEDTVKHHLTNIFNKTGLSSRVELALFALHHGLVKAQ